MEELEERLEDLEDGLEFLERKLEAVLNLFSLLESGTLEHAEFTMACERANADKDARRVAREARRKRSARRQGR